MLKQDKSVFNGPLAHRGYDTLRQRGGGSGGGGGFSGRAETGRPPRRVVLASAYLQTIQHKQRAIQTESRLVINYRSEKGRYF